MLVFTRHVFLLKNNWKMKELSKLRNGDIRTTERGVLERLAILGRAHYRSIFAVCILCVVSECTISCDFYYIIWYFHVLIRLERFLFESSILFKLPFPLSLYLPLSSPMSDMIKAKLYVYILHKLNFIGLYHLFMIEVVLKLVSTSK